MPLKIGDEAPDFALISFTPSEEPAEISLSSYKGKKNVLILFFPQSFTGVCTDEMCIISESEIKPDSNLDILGISVDGTFVQKAFAKSNNIKFPLLSDFGKKTIKDYDVVQKDFAHGMHDVSQRAVFLLDKKGIIRYIEVTENPGVQINLEKLKEEIKKLS